jgi:hypothetical protein
VAHFSAGAGRRQGRIPKRKVRGRIGWAAMRQVPRGRLFHGQPAISAIYVDNDHIDIKFTL